MHYVAYNDRMINVRVIGRDVWGGGQSWLILKTLPRHFPGETGEKSGEWIPPVILDINPLQTKRRPLYLKTQSVPRCKHFSSRL